MPRGDEPAYPSFTDRLLCDPKNEEMTPIYSGGMTVREQFAMAAMQGILAGKAGHLELWDSETDEMTAKQAIEHADALLAELQKEKP